MSLQPWWGGCGEKSGCGLAPAPLESESSTPAATPNHAHTGPGTTDRSGWRCWHPGVPISS
eukprot:3932213-Rhodomonas_salina.2